MPVWKANILWYVYFCLTHNAHLNTETQTQSHAILTSHSTLQHTRIKRHAWSELKGQPKQITSNTLQESLVTLIRGGWQDYLTSLTMPKGAITLGNFLWICFRQTTISAAMVLIFLWFSATSVIFQRYGRFHQKTTALLKIISSITKKQMRTMPAEILIWLKIHWKFAYLV